MIRKILSITTTKKPTTSLTSLIQEELEKDIFRQATNQAAEATEVSNPTPFPDDFHSMQVEELCNDRKHNKNSSTENNTPPQPKKRQRRSQEAHTPKGTTKPATPPFQPTVLSLLIGGDDVYNAHHILDQINTDPGTAQTLFTERPEYWKPACEKIALLRIAIIAETTQTASIDPYTKEQLIGALLKEKPANATAMECLETIYEGKQAKIECVMSLTGSDLVLRLFLQGRYFDRYPSRTHCIS